MSDALNFCLRLFSFDLFTEDEFIKKSKFLSMDKMFEEVQQYMKVKMISKLVDAPC